MSSATHNQQTGIVLILALLIISAVLGIAVVFSNLIIREIQQARLIDQSVQAYYAAESGGERALYQVRRREGIIDCSLLGTPGSCTVNGVCSNNATVPCINTVPGNLPVTHSWELNISNEMETSVLLSRGQSFQLDLFNPAQSANAGIDAIQISSDVGSLQLLTEFTNLTRVLDIQPATACNEQLPVIKGIIATGAAGAPVSVSAVDGSSLLDECAYSLRLNYLLSNGATHSVITLTAHNRVTGPEPIPSRLIIDAEAISGRSLQRLRVRTPVRPPVSGLYDFVLFSEEQIVK